MLIVARTKLVDDLDTADNPGEVEELRKFEEWSEKLSTATMDLVGEGIV